MANLPCHVCQHHPNPYFVGREVVLKRIHRHLHRPGPVPRSDHAQVGQVLSHVRTASYVISGPPGQGKTQTALKYFFDHQDYYKATLWAHADTEAKLLVSFSEIAQRLRLIERSSDLRIDAACLLRWFEDDHSSALACFSNSNKATANIIHSDVPWLLVFDNAEDATLINSFWPHSRNGAILITSRNPAFATSNVGGVGEFLPPLSEASAVQMVKAQVPKLFTGGENDEKEALEVVKRVGCLPLGIQASIGLINEADCSLRDYNQQWTNPMAVLKDARKKHVFRNFAPYENVGDELEEVWLGSLTSLDAHSRFMIEIFALLDPDNIQEEELFKVAQGWQASKLVMVANNRVRCTGALLSRSLVGSNARSHRSDPRCVNVHRLLQACTQKHMDADSRQEAFNGAAIVLSSALTHLWESNWPKIRKEYKEIFPHVQSVHRFYRETTSAEEKITDTPLEFLQVMHKAAS